MIVLSLLLYRLFVRYPFLLALLMLGQMGANSLALAEEEKVEFEEKIEVVLHAERRVVQEAETTEEFVESPTHVLRSEAEVTELGFLKTTYYRLFILYQRLLIGLLEGFVV